MKILDDKITLIAFRINQVSYLRSTNMKGQLSQPPGSFNTLISWRTWVQNADMARRGGGGG